MKSRDKCLRRRVCPAVGEAVAVRACSGGLRGFSARTGAGDVALGEEGSGVGREEGLEVVDDATEDDGVVGIVVVGSVGVDCVGETAAFAVVEGGAVVGGGVSTVVGVVGELIGAEGVVCADSAAVVLKGLSVYGGTVDDGAGASVVLGCGLPVVLAALVVRSSAFVDACVAILKGLGVVLPFGLYVLMGTRGSFSRWSGLLCSSFFLGLDSLLCNAEGALAFPSSIDWLSLIRDRRGVNEFKRFRSFRRGLGVLDKTAELFLFNSSFPEALVNNNF